MVLTGDMNARVGLLSSNETFASQETPLVSSFVFLKTGNVCWPCVQTVECFSLVRASEVPIAVTPLRVRIPQVAGVPKLTTSLLATNSAAVYKTEALSSTPITR